MIRVFEAFAGYGSQRLALARANISFEVVGISEIEGDVILSYAAIHEGLLHKREKEQEESDLEMISYLEKINVPLNYKTFENRAKKLKGQKLKDMYIANMISNNFGDIRLIDPTTLPDFDFFTYSFPCQDISVAGFQNGLEANSGTRSSLLWECCKIIKEKKPTYLMMENVKNLIGKNHKANYEEFLAYLESLGYTNYWKVLNARDYGIPQNRERVFCISILNNSKQFKFPNPIELKTFMNDLLEENVAQDFYLKNNQFSSEPIVQDYIYCLDSNYWKGTFLKDFLSKKRRQLVSGTVRDDGNYPARRLTPRETWRFMGVDDSDFEKAEELVSNTSLYKQSGNSIVVPVMEAIFKELFNDYKEDSIMESNKERILEIFYQRVRGQIPDVSGLNSRHDGRRGHWLEQQFGVKPNADNNADLYGYELKNETTSGKTTFGDWSANEYIFKTGPYVDLFDGTVSFEKQNSFCRMFGKANMEKDGRYSWSGSPIPKINCYNFFGQIMIIDSQKDIVIYYSYMHDQRLDKEIIIPLELQKGEIELARWYGESWPRHIKKGGRDKTLKEKLEDKFDDLGWFTCKTDFSGAYYKICFGEPVTFENWIELVANGIVYFDSGMYEGNKRPYSQWRANNSYWDSLITECYE